ncbi:MAG: hypothetical protein J0I12_24140 [Candidatus Eremiobacteraeota bacterium]|nr:hypothetical protein [Candidatus Eremiobacteraeota bacterium]
MKKLLTILLLSLPAVCATAGLTLTNCSLTRETTSSSSRSQQYGDLRGFVRLSNDSGLNLTHLQVKVHVLDGYGKQLFDLNPPEIAQMKPGQQSELSLYSPYSGGVMQFKLSLDITAQSPQGQQSYTVAARDAAPPVSSKPTGW